MLTTKDKAEQNKGRMVVGIDLGRYSVQISYMRSGMEAPEMAEQVIGSEVFNIPMILCKRVGVNQWFYGREAIKYYEKEGGFLVDNILQKAIKGENEVIDGISYEGTALLSLFVKRSLSILGGAHMSGAISDIMFTCEELDSRVIEVMSRVTGNLSLRDCNVYFQSYAESIYNYMIHQEAEIWSQNVLLAYFDGNRLVNYTFSRNQRTTPIVSFVDTAEEIPLSLPQIITEDSRPAAYERLDAQFLEYMKEAIGMEYFSGVYLLGDGFKDEWISTSLHFLGKNRRLFIGNDLFSRGACYSLMDKYEPTETAKQHVYLGPDKLKSNVGMNVLRRGEESYLALLDAGVNWFDVKADYQLFMSDDYTFRFIIIPLDGGEHTEHVITIDNPPERDVETVRIALSMNMSDINTIKIHLEDMGFGGLYPSSGLTWDFEITI